MSGAITSSAECIQIPKEFEQGQWGFDWMGVLWWTAAFFMTRAAVVIFYMAVYKYKTFDAIDVSSKFVAILSHSIVGPLSMWNMDWSNVFTVPFLYCHRSQFLAAALVPFVSYNLQDLLTAWCWDPKAINKQDKALIMGHHLFMILIFPIAFSCGFAHQFILWCMSTEVTGVPLTLSSLSRKWGAPTKTVDLLMNMFGLIFLLYRLPISILFYATMMSKTPWSSMLDLGFSPSLAACSSCMLIPSGLNLFWSYKILSRLQRKMGAKSASKSD